MFHFYGGDFQRKPSPKERRDSQIPSLISLSGGTVVCQPSDSQILADGHPTPDDHENFPNFYLSRESPKHSPVTRPSRRSLSLQTHHTDYGPHLYSPQPSMSQIPSYMSHTPYSSSHISKTISHLPKCKSSRSLSSRLSLPHISPINTSSLSRGGTSFDIPMTGVAEADFDNNKYFGENIGNINASMNQLPTSPTSSTNDDIEIENVSIISRSQSLFEPNNSSSSPSNPKSIKNIILRMKSNRKSASKVPTSPLRSDSWRAEYRAYQKMLRGDICQLGDKEATDFAEDAEMKLSLQIYNDIRLKGLARSRPRRRHRQGLSPDELKMATDILKGRLQPNNKKNVFIEKFNVDITRDLLLCLQPGEWLNDEIINFYMNLLQERNTRHLQQNQNIPKVYFWNTFFYTKLSGETEEGLQSYCYANVSRWTKRKNIDIFAYEWVLVPVHVKKIHWTLGALNMKSRLIYFFDSMNGSYGTVVRDYLLRYIKDEHLDKKKKPLPDPDAWQLDTWTYYPVPQQTNGSDCGVFVCQFCESLSEGREFDFDEKDLRDRRLKMVSQIVRGIIE